MSADTGGPAVGVDWSPSFAARTRRRSAEVAAILAATPPGVLSLAGGFPHPGTFPADVVGELVARILRDDAAALQYTPVGGHPGPALVPDRAPGAAPGSRARGRRAARHERRHGGDRAGLPGAGRSRGHDRGRGADVPRRADGVRGLRGHAGGDPDGRRRARRRRVRRAARGRDAAEAAVRDPGVPEPDRPHAAARAPAGAGRAVPPPRRADPRGRRLPRDRVRRRAAAVAVVAGTGRRRPGRHVLEDLRARRAARLGDRPARRAGADGGRQADHRPVLERLRPADRRGVRPQRRVRAPAARAAASCTRATGGRSRRRSAGTRPTAAPGRRRAAASSPG